MIVELTDDEFRNFQIFIYDLCGIRVADTKRTLLSNRIRRRLKSGEFTDFQSYFDYVTSAAGKDELSSFLDVVTTHETFFFRTETHFAWLRNKFLPEVARQARAGNRSKTLRIWSAACSTGEEAYSLAICLAENELRLRDIERQIVGTDISNESLEAAKKGEYGQRVMAGVSDVQRRRYFEKPDDDHWRIRPAIRELVSFRQHNLMKPLQLEPFDCIFIRNVLIYFDRESKKTVVDHLIDSMADGAFLVVGPSEGIYDLLGPLKRLQPFLYQK